MKNYAACALQFACCCLRHTLPQAAAQATARKLQRAGPIVFCVRTRNRVYVYTHAARNLNCWEFHFAISGNIIVEIVGILVCLTRCGMRPAAMGRSSVGTGGTCPPPMDYMNANVNSLIFTIGAHP